MNSNGEKERYHAIIIGAGFAGLGFAIQLRRAGLDDFIVLEKGARLGGVWRDNVYPGVACDVPVYLYSYSFEPNPNWSRFFAPQKEILAYLDHCADKYDVRSKIRTNAGVTRAIWNEADSLWSITTEDGRELEARVIICAAGIGLTKPILPKIDGLDTVEGIKVFHSSRWDASADLDGKAVAVIGTGASAIQIVPAIAPRVGKLYVFQRTPPWIVSRPDRAITARQQAIFRKRPAVQKAARTAIYWVLEGLGSGFFVDKRINELREKIARRYIAQQVRDRELRAKVTPTYTLGCKRILFSSDYYPAIQRPNVELVTDKIHAVRGRSVITKPQENGVETSRDVDAIICATGFEAAEARVLFELRGRDGREIGEHWKDGMLAYLGTSVSGFPNFFFLIGPNTALGHSSMIFMMESQYPYVLGAVKTLADGKTKQLTVKEDRSREYNKQIQARLARTVWSTGGCSSWYTTSSGLNTTLWPGFTWEFRLRTRRFDVESYDAR